MKLTPADTIWMDGEFVPWDQAQVHVLTPSLHYGWGVYEGIRAYPTADGPAVFRLRDHLKRLHDSARVYLMDPGWTLDELTEASLELLHRTGLESGYLRPIVYLGYGAMGVAPASVDDRPTAAAGCGPITAHMRDAFHDVVRGRNSAYRHWLEYVGSTQRAGAAPAADSMAILEDGVAQLADAAATLFDDNRPAAVARREEAADRVVDLIAARAWQALTGPSGGPALTGPSGGPALTAAARSAAYVIAADAVLAGGQDSAGLDTFALTEDAIVMLTIPEHFDACVDRARELLGTTPEGRLCAAWQIVNDGLQTLNTTRHEWVGADPATVAAAGWVLVDRIGRLLIAAALVAQAAKGGPAANTEPLVNAARRYAWNHLRRPAPEAATATHVQRSADLIRAIGHAPQEIPQ